MSFFRKIWAVWGIVLCLVMFALSLPVVLAMLFLFGEKGRRWATFFLHHLFTRVFFSLVLVKIKVSGRKNLKRGTSYVIVSNHASSLDFMANAKAFPGSFRFLAKQELLKIPIFGFIVRKMCLIVDRKSAISRARSVVELKKVLEAGWSVLLYPEGSRHSSSEADPLGKFYDGAFRLAIQTKAPIAVCTIQNVREINRKADRLDLGPGILRLSWSEPIPTAEMSAEDIPFLIEKVRAMMVAEIRSV